MNEIVADIVEIIKGAPNEIEGEHKVWRYLNEQVCHKFVEALESIDRELVSEYEQRGYHSQRSDSRTVYGLFGAITYRRHHMKREGEPGFYPLDRELGFEKHQRFTPCFQYNVARVAAHSVYRSTAEAVNLLTPVSISHQTVGAIVKAAGEMYTAYEQAQNEREPEQEEELKRPTVLYLEGDGVVIRGQGIKQQEIHRFQIATGVKVHGKRRELEGVHVVADTSRKAAADMMREYIERYFDLSQCLVLSNSDGGSGYEAEVFADIVEGCKSHEHFRDRYHVNEKIKQRLNFADKELVNRLHRMLWAYRWEDVCTCLDTAESQAENYEQADQVRRLRDYLERNWPYLKPARMRPGIESCSKGIGTCESNHRIYTYRMKRQGRRWGKKGGLAMIKIITGLRNGDLGSALTSQADGCNKPQSQALKSAVRNVLKKTKFIQHIGVHHGGIYNAGPTSSAIGHLKKMLVS